MRRIVSVFAVGAICNLVACGNNPADKDPAPEIQNERTSGGNDELAKVINDLTQRIEEKNAAELAANGGPITPGPVGVSAPVGAPRIPPLPFLGDETPEPGAVAAVINPPRLEGARFFRNDGASEFEFRSDGLGVKKVPGQNKFGTEFTYRLINDPNGWMLNLYYALSDDEERFADIEIKRSDIDPVTGAVQQFILNSDSDKTRYNLVPDESIFSVGDSLPPLRATP